MEATTPSIGAASDAIDVAEDRPYGQRPRRERAMEERAVLSPQPDEPLTRGDLPSAGREARQDKGDRREPRTSRLFGAAAANAGRGGRASPACGRFSDKLKFNFYSVLVLTFYSFHSIMFQPPFCLSRIFSL